MKRLLVILLCLLALFAVVSCKNEPKAKEKESIQEDTEDQDSDVVYSLTSTVADTRFQFKWDEVALSGGKVFTLMYKSEKAIAEFTIRDPSADKYANCVAMTDYIEGPDEDGWITFSYTIPEGAHEGIGLAFFESGDAAIGDVLYVKEIYIGEDPLTLAQANSWAGNGATIAVVK